MANHDVKSLSFVQGGNTYTIKPAIHYAVCESGATTQNKSVTIPGITALDAGLSVRIKFTNAQNYNGVPKIKINNLSAISITRSGTVNAGYGEWEAGQVLDFVYDGTSFIRSSSKGQEYTPASAAPGNIATSGAVGTSTNYARQDHTHGIALATGDSDGQVKIAGTNVSVKGLGSAAYTNSTNYVAKTGDTMTGDLLKSASAGTVLKPDATSFYASPVPSSLWHDLFAFCRVATPTYYTSSDGSNWTQATLEKRLFSHQEHWGNSVVLSNSIRGSRWQWQSNQFGWSNGSWLILGITYCEKVPTFNVILETSTDGSSWATLSSSTGISANQQPIWIKTNIPSGIGYVRLTLTVNTISDTSAKIGLSSIRWLSARWGDQGQGSELEHPYQWNGTPDILPLTHDTSSLGSSSLYWKNAYITNINGVAVGSSPSFSNTWRPVSDSVSSTSSSDAASSKAVKTAYDKANTLFVGATSGADGAAGIVPKPYSADRHKFLCGDGTWAMATGKMFVVNVGSITNASGSYNGTITNSDTADITADMKCILMEVDDDTVFRAPVTITPGEGSITISCDEMVGTVEVTLSFMFVTDSNPFTSSEFDILSNRIGSLSGLTTTDKSNVVSAVNEVNDHLANLIVETTVNHEAGSVGSKEQVYMAIGTKTGYHPISVYLPEYAGGGLLMAFNPSIDNGGIWFTRLFNISSSNVSFPAFTVTVVWMKD